MKLYAPGYGVLVAQKPVSVEVVVVVVVTYWLVQGVNEMAGMSCRLAGTRELTTVF